MLLDQSKHLSNQTRALTAKYTLRFACLAQVLAGEPAREEIRAFRQRPKRRDIVMQGHLRKALSEDGCSVSFDFTEETRLMPSARKAELYAADASEQPHNLKLARSDGSRWLCRFLLSHERKQLGLVAFHLSCVLVGSSLGAD